MKKTAKRLLSAFLSCLLTVSMFSLPATAQTQSKAAEDILGDVNLDGDVDGIDALLIEQYCIGKEKLSDRQLAVADVNEDGSVDGIDALSISQFVVGKLTELGTTTIALSQPTLTMDLGSTAVLEAALSNNPCNDRTVRWSSSDDSVVSVSSDGTLTANKTGRATITAALFNGQQDRCEVTVKKDVYKGIDVSFYQNVIDWEAVAASGIDFAMLRTTYGSYDDNDDQRDACFKTNIVGAAQVGLDVGAYHFTYATTEAVAREEADYFLRMLEPYREKITYPVVIDVEYGMELVGRDQLTDAVIAFCEKVEEAGYYPMVYANSNYWENALDYNRLKKYDIWVANHNSQVSYPPTYQMWQYSDTGSVDGIDGNVDLNESYVDYKNLIADLNLQPSPSYHPQPEIYREGTIKADGTKLYDGINEGTIVADNIKAGTKVEVFGKYYNKNTKITRWRIQLPTGEIGWLRQEYLTLPFLEKNSAESTGF